ncbi:hypothetical protein HY772_09115 [Candidatus Woesearchaeota archaeon]|nr:hypothetical protein [Candidatus Woesearchaeota archaeon]
MHTKDAGTVGELAVILQLKQAGYTVFTEVGDNSSIDLIVVVNDQLLRGQVKSCQTVNGAATLPLRKAGPNGYLRKYIDDVNTIDFFALYVHDTGDIAYILAKEAFESCPGSTRLTFRIDPPKNGQEQGVRYLKDYTDFEGVLRDYEQRT